MFIIIGGEDYSTESIKTTFKDYFQLFITFGAKIIEGEISIQDENEISGVEWVGIQRANELMPYHPTGVQKLLKYSSIYTF